MKKLTEFDIITIRDHETSVWGLLTEPENAENDDALSAVCDIIDELIEDRPILKKEMKFSGSLRDDYEREIRFLLSFTEFRLSISEDFFEIL